LSVAVAGEFSIREDKKNPPMKVVAKNIGMIAGGTGKPFK
jgi:hypothetical protein